MGLSWTNWKRLINLNEIFDVPAYSGAACYILASGGPQGGNLKTKYIGETSNLHSRMLKYASKGSHCAVRILMELRQGNHLFYRYVKTKSKADAKMIQDTLKDRYPQTYPWNGEC